MTVQQLNSEAIEYKELRWVLEDCFRLRRITKSRRKYELLGKLCYLIVIEMHRVMPISETDK